MYDSTFHVLEGRPVKHLHATAIGTIDGVDILKALFTSLALPLHDEQYRLKVLSIFKG